ncbi:hypothetical protein [Ferrovibrio sp.]|uniref:hypothetical protein n=1 Tax=Ferrovibrio sp. TaxID=1917215 RepID=UPI00391C58CD
MLHRALHEDGADAGLHGGQEAAIIFRRSVGMHIDFCAGILTCLENGQIRSAFSLLRTSLELTTKFSWLQSNYKMHLSKYLEGNTPNVKAMMHHLGWDREYIDFYTPLCAYVHGDYGISNITKFITHDPSQASFYAEVYTLPHEKKFVVIDDHPKKTLIKMYGPIIGLKTFDSTITTLMRGSGKYADAFRWWPHPKVIDWFNVQTKSQEHETHFLWSSEKQRLAICLVEGKYK